MFGHFLVFVVLKLKKLWVDLYEPRFVQKPVLEDKIVFDKFKWLFWSIYIGVFLYTSYWLVKVAMIYQRRRNSIREATRLLKKAVDNMRKDVDEPVDPMSFNGGIPHNIQDATKSGKESSHTNFVYPSTSEEQSDNESNGDKLMAHASTVVLLDKCNIVPGLEPETVSEDPKCRISMQPVEHHRLDGGETSRQEIAENSHTLSLNQKDTTKKSSGDSKQIPPNLTPPVYAENMMTSKDFKVNEQLSSANLILNMGCDEKFYIYNDGGFKLPMPVAAVSRTELYIANVISDTSDTSELSASEANMDRNQCSYGNQMPNKMLFDDTSSDTLSTTVSTLNISTTSLDTDMDSVSTISDSESAYETTTSEVCVPDPIDVVPSYMHNWDLESRTCDCHIDFMIQEFGYVMPKFDEVVPMLRSRSVSRISVRGSFRRAHSAPAASLEHPIPCLCLKLAKSDGSLLNLLNSNYPYNNFMEN